MATQSAFFSPAKYGILPEVLRDTDLSAANGILELTTNIAILLGTVGGIWIFSVFNARLEEAGLIYLGLAVLGTGAILFVPHAPHGNRRARFAWNVLGSIGQDLREARRVPQLYYTILGIAYFGFLGSLFLIALPVFARNGLGLDEGSVGILLGILSLGIGAGSIAAARLSRNHVELGLVPLGSVGISLFALMLSGFGPGSSHAVLLGLPIEVAVVIGMLGFSSGLFIVPLNSLLQQRSPAGMKGRLIAFSNVLTFAGVLLAGAIPWLLSTVLSLTTGEVIVFAAVLTFVATVYIVTMLPDFLVRLILWILTNTVYSVRTVGEENLPTQGALLVANHVSWVDALLVAASCDRMVRFLMFRPYYEWRPLNWFFRMMHAVPVAASDSPDKVEESLSIARHEIDRGHAVCIFAEGSITRTGNLLKFKRGLERIAKHAECPIVPIYLEGVWGSIFSFDRGRFIFKRPRMMRSPVTVYFGRPLPPTARAAEVRQSIQELSSLAFRARKARQKPIHVRFIRTCKRRWRRIFAIDGDGRRIRFGQALVRTLAIRDAVFGRGDGAGERVGILLPPGIDAAIANFAVLMSGRIPVNLDPTAPGRIARSMIDSSRITSVITARGYLERSGCAGSLTVDRVIDFDEACKSTAASHPALRTIFCRILPVAWIRRLMVDGDVEDVSRPATILYSYPPEDPDRPRGAILSHHNLLSNLESLRQVFRVTRRDRILGLLPFSNSMSFTGTLLLPALSGASVVYAADLIESDTIGKVLADTDVSLIAATPALLSRLIRHVAPDQLRNLRHVAVGGEAMHAEVAEEFSRRFGVEPLEGYGSPECAPIVSLNIPDYGHGRTRQPGGRAGTAGHPIPGVSIRIVDPETHATLPPGDEGLLLVSGPNVMSGYVNDPQLTEKVLDDGWFVTGDMARMDAEGFLVLLGRMSPSPTPVA